MPSLPSTFSQIADGGDLELKMFGLTTKFNKMSEVSKTNETPAIGNVLLAAGEYPSLDEMALKEARKIIDKFNEFDVFSEACEMADYMITEILDIGVIKFGHKPTSDFYVRVREYIREIWKSNGRNW